MVVQLKNARQPYKEQESAANADQKLSQLVQAVEQRADKISQCPKGQKQAKAEGHRRKSDQYRG